MFSTTPEIVVEFGFGGRKFSNADFYHSMRFLATCARLPQAGLAVELASGVVGYSAQAVRVT
jgi:hypothetical protein